MDVRAEVSNSFFSRYFFWFCCFSGAQNISHMLGGLFPKLVIGGVVLPVLLCSGCAVPSFRPCDPGAHNPHSCYDYFHKTLYVFVQPSLTLSFLFSFVLLSY